MNFKCNHIDALNLESCLEQREKELLYEISKIKSKRDVLKKRLQENDDGDRLWIIELPVDVLPERNTQKTQIAWKTLVWAILEKYNMPMTSEMIFHKLLLIFPEVPFEKRKVVSNCSAALHYLEVKEQKLFRTKLTKRKDFIYGFRSFFNLNLQLKKEHLRNFLSEEGKQTHLNISREIEAINNH